MEEVLKIAGIILVIVLVICVAPLIFLWSVNSLAELGGANFYIAHSVWSYFVTFVFLVVMKASKS